MNKEAYEKLIGYIRRSGILTWCVWAASRILPLMMAALFAGTSCVLVFLRHPLTVRFVIVPAFVFVFVSIFRKIVNRTRPYDAFGYEPLLRFEPGKGRSFPSRHTASAFVIAFAFYWLHPITGAVFIVMALCVAVSRVLAGMHYISDVLAGTLVSVIAAVVGNIIF